MLPSTATLHCRLLVQGQVLGPHTLSSGLPPTSSVTVSKLLPLSALHFLVYEIGRILGYENRTRKGKALGMEPGTQTRAPQTLVPILVTWLSALSVRSRYLNPALLCLCFLPLGIRRPPTPFHHSAQLWPIPSLSSLT